LEISLIKNNQSSKKHVYEKGTKIFKNVSLLPHNSFKRYFEI